MQHKLQPVITACEVDGGGGKDAHANRKINIPHFECRIAAQKTADVNYLHFGATCVLCLYVFVDENREANVAVGKK